MGSLGVCYMFMSCMPNLDVYLVLASMVFWGQLCFLHLVFQEIKEIHLKFIFQSFRTFCIICDRLMLPENA